MKNVEWGEFRLWRLFTIKRGKRLTVENRIVGNRPLVTAGFENTGIAGYIGNLGQETFPKDTITIDMFANTFYRDYNYSADDNILVLFDRNQMPSKAKHFIVTQINNTLQKKFSYGKQYRMGSFRGTRIQLPTKNGEIDFDFMENFVAEIERERIKKLENYLAKNGLNDYELTEQEKKTLESFESGNIKLQESTYKSIFNNIKQGRRLKKDDQVSGNLPFVMAGVTNTGVVNYISNPVTSFPKNSITVDIFGNTFYRNYDYGAGDDTGVYWHNKIKHPKGIMIFFASAMKKSIKGKFDYGKKLRSSKSFDFKIQLPTKNNKPDYETMETVISAIHKLVIKNVVLYVEKKKAALKKLTEHAIA